VFSRARLIILQQQAPYAPSSNEYEVPLPANVRAGSVTCMRCMAWWFAEEVVARVCFCGVQPADEAGILCWLYAYREVIGSFFFKARQHLPAWRNGKYKAARCVLRCHFFGKFCRAAYAAQRLRRCKQRRVYGFGGV
jgi:hypothetical protein